MINAGQYNDADTEKKYMRLGKHLLRHPPDVMWGLQLLSTINEHHELFEPGYKPPKAEPEGRAQVGMVPVREGFFDNLVPLSGKEARGRGSINFLSKKEKVEQEIALMRQRQEKADAQMRKKQAQLLLLEDDDEDDDFGGRVKVTMRDFELLQQFKAQQALLIPLPDQLL